MQLERERELAAQARRLTDEHQRDRAQLLQESDARAAGMDAARRREERRCEELEERLRGATEQGRARCTQLEAAWATANERAISMAADAAAERRGRDVDRATAAADAAEQAWRAGLALRELSRVEREFSQALMMAQEALACTSEGAAEVVALRVEAAALREAAAADAAALAVAAARAERQEAALVLAVAGLRRAGEAVRGRERRQAEAELKWEYDRAMAQ
eukprot:scaffold25624_cov99-Isochrysis_galbana.AAC.4